VDNFVVHIHLYLTNRETELTAYNNLKRIKNAGFKVLVTSPRPLPLDFYQYIDHFYYDKENQLMSLKYDNADPIVWWNHSIGLKLHFVVDGFQRHGLAVLRSMIKGSEIAKALGYTNIIRFEFDDFFGFNSLNNIKDICKEIEQNQYDFYAYRNDYGGDRLNVSTHLIFYTAESFIKLFGSIKNEYDYKEVLKDVGLENRAIILEEFIYKVIQNNDVNIVYHDGNLMNIIFSDTAFNMHQSAIGVYDGALSDVMRVKYGEHFDLEELCLAAQNSTSESPVMIYFDIYNHEKKLVKTVEIYLQLIGEWRYEHLYDTKDFSEIKIRHQESPHHKTFKLYQDNGGINILNVDMPGSDNFQEIIFDSKTNS